MLFSDKKMREHPDLAWVMYDKYENMLEAQRTAVSYFAEMFRLFRLLPDDKKDSVIKQVEAYTHRTANKWKKYDAEDAMCETFFGGWNKLLDENGTIPPELDGYDWGEVFKYADKPDECPPGAKVSLKGFNREDVAEVLYSVVGENEGPDWIAVVRLYDGRFAMVRAGCGDYTGWDRQAGGESAVADSITNILFYGLDDGDSERLSKNGNRIRS